MAKMSTTYETKFRRRREGKTDYRKRLALLKGNAPRFVVRKSNNHMLVQVISYLPKGDVILASAHSTELEEAGWKGHNGNLSAAYLTGMLAGLKAKKAKVKNCVADIGMVMPVHGSRTFAAIKGGIDAGLEIPADESAFPSEERIIGKHIAGYADKAKGNQFAAMKKKGTAPEKMPEHFEQVKKELQKKFA